MQVYDLISMQNLGDARFLPQDLSVKGGSVAASAMQIIPLLFFKKFFSEPSDAPINDRARNLSSTSILAQWGEVPDTDKNGIMLSYTVNYEANPESSLQRSLVVNASTREVTLTGLEKNTEYKIMLFANTSKGGGNESEPVTVKMDEVYHCTGY